MEIAELTLSNAAAWARLFEVSASPCFCRYWHFRGTKNEWLARCAADADANRREQLASLERRDPEARGLLALEEGQAIGWLKLTPRASVDKLRRLPVYARLPLGEPEGVYVIGCLLVRPDRRLRGVAKALVAAADAFVLAWGGHAVEAYPRRSAAPLHDEEAWMGPCRLFDHEGYVAGPGEDPYRVHRKTLRE